MESEAHIAAVQFFFLNIFIAVSHTNPIFKETVKHANRHIYRVDVERLTQCKLIAHDS